MLAKKAQKHNLISFKLKKHKFYFLVKLKNSKNMASREITQCLYAHRPSAFLLFSKAENQQTSKYRRFIFCSNKDIKSAESSETFLNIKLFNKINGQHSHVDLWSKLRISRVLLTLRGVWHGFTPFWYFFLTT